VYLIAGNWKMNGLPASARELASGIAGKSKAGGVLPEIALCPPSALIPLVAEELSGSPVRLGGQDCHMNENGAHTGDTSAVLLSELGCKYVIVGHSERRADHGETDEMVKLKALAAQHAGLVPIICVGETEAERNEGRTEQVISRQVAGSVPEGANADNVVIAYEPVWAIGTGRTATEEDIETAHAQIRVVFSKSAGPAEKLCILYGGSVKGANAGPILKTKGVNGALVGGASLKVDDFWAIIEACP